MRITALILGLTLLAAFAGSQTVDRTDPVAVAKAYIEACRSDNAAAAFDLIDPDDPLLPIFRDAAAEIVARLVERLCGEFG